MPEGVAASFEWLEVFYNRPRLQIPSAVAGLLRSVDALGYKSPVDFENQIN